MVLTAIAIQHILEITIKEFSLTVMMLKTNKVELSVSFLNNTQQTV